MFLFSEIKDNCKPIQPPKNGKMRCARSRHKAQLFYRTKCNVWCDKGFKLVGPSVKNCNGSGHWDDEPIACVRK